MVSSFAPCPPPPSPPSPHFPLLCLAASLPVSSSFSLLDPSWRGGERNFSLEIVFFSGNALCESFFIPISFS